MGWRTENNKTTCYDKVDKVYNALLAFVAQLRKIQKFGIPHVKNMADAIEKELLS